MNSKTRNWLYNLGSAVIGGASGSVVSGVTSMGFDPQKFNLTDSAGILRLLGLMGVNFLFSAILSMFFYLKQSPLPPEDTQFITKVDVQKTTVTTSANPPKDNTGI